MFDEDRIWAAAEATPGVAVNTLKQIVAAFELSEPGKEYQGRARSDKQVEGWSHKRHTKWSALFNHFGGEQVSTSQLAGHLMRANCSILKELYRMEEDGWIIRDGTSPHAVNGKPLQHWTWVGRNNAKH